MHPHQVKQEFPKIEQTIHSAAQLCQTHNDVPDELRQCIGELERESDQAASLFEQEQNDNRIVACVDKLEKISDRAMQACKQAGHVDEQVKQAVQQTHGALSHLKHQLH
ncbi:MAG: hypothetical protein ACTHL1_10170 [Burkholderiaceae bacterium]